MTPQFDYVIVGAGSSGCVVAARLSEDPATSVLLLEAGPDNRNFWLHLPIGFYRTAFNPRFSWCHVTEADPTSGGRRHAWSRGRVLGGSSAINGSLYVRGQHEDYDAWARLGNPGWSFREVLPYFKRSEDNERGRDPFHGSGGALRVSDPHCRDMLSDAFIRAAAALGIPENPDFNGQQQHGAGYYQFTTRGSRRESAATAFLPATVRRRKNLTIITEALATKVLFEGRRAIGIAYQKGSRAAIASARREVILSGGTVNSPALLQHSGVGPGELLQKLGISTVAHAPEVGRNMQDHYNVYTLAECTMPITWNILTRRWGWKISSMLRFLAGVKGPLTAGAAQAGGFAKTHPALERPDVQFHLLPYITTGPPPRLEKFSGFSLAACQLRPHSRGSVEIQSPDPKVPPRICANYLADARDQQVVVDALRLSRRVLEAGPLQPIVREIIRPCLGSDDELLDFARNFGRTVFHPVATCRMGPEPTAVVDPQLRVRGVEGLRVADASVMPLLVSGNTNAAAIMIGEKAADMIRSSTA